MPKPLISMIAAMSENRVIGNGDQIPWHIPEDFKYFKEKTLGKPVIFGRATFESIHKIRGTEPNIPALPKRKNIIVTRQADYQAKDCPIASSLEDAIEQASAFHEEIMICGGGQIYTEGLHHADRLYITIIDGEYEGDVFFPEWSDEEWRMVSSDPRDGFTFYVYDRVKD